MTTDSVNTRETWLTDAAALIVDQLLTPLLTTEQLKGLKYRVSIGNTQSKKAVGECWHSSASADKTNEIFISPARSNSVEILATLLHEIIHAADDLASGHKGFFASTAKAAGLTGKMTSTTAGPELTTTLNAIISVLGDIPHAILDPTLSGKTKQKNRQRLIQCDCCGFKFRSSKTQLESIQRFECIACDTGTLIIQDD
jgi:hypothetical protein